MAIAAKPEREVRAPGTRAATKESFLSKETRNCGKS